MFQSALSRRQTRACKIIAVTSGGMYDIHKITWLTMLGLLANVCGSLLIYVET